MHPGYVVERLRDFDPARQHRDIGNEADIAHQVVSCRPWIAAQHPQFSLIGREAQNGVERGGLARAVRTNESQNPALFNSQVHAIQRDGCAKSFAKTAGFNACHGSMAPPLDHSISMCRPKTGGAALSASGPTAEWLREPWAILRQEISGARLAAADRARRFLRTSRDLASSPPILRLPVVDSPSGP